MFFIGLLMASTTAIAFAAAYFSVYGLANTFAGVFWSVVVMGASLEAGKLVAASYLYRYWDKTNFMLKSYLMAGVAALMVLTSTGIFGYLSTGYQQDVLPLQQKTEQIKLLEDEKARTLARKTQIDTLIASGPALTSLNQANGKIDPNAARTLRETTKARASVVGQYKDEQIAVTKHVSELDAQLLELKQDILKVQAHVGPIIYIAKAFGLPADDATKYLIFIIIFAFDPMAVAMTIATNNAIRLREMAKAAPVEVIEDAIEVESEPTVDTEDEPTPEVEVVTPEPVVELPTEDPYPMEKIVSDFEPTLPAIDESLLDVKLEEPEPEAAAEIVLDETTPEINVLEQPNTVLEQTPEVTTETEPVVEGEPVVEPILQPVLSTGRKFRPAHDRWTGGDISGAKIRELINHHKYLKAKQDTGDHLDQNEAWELNTIEAVLKKHGVDMYL